MGRRQFRVGRVYHPKTEPTTAAISDTDNEDADYNPPQQFNAPADNDTSEESPAHESEAVRSPIEYFQGFFDDNVLHLILQQSNLYAVQQKANKPLA
ncbi:hypothetical protein HPB47_021607, partial [Ixodes persulcatus]